MKDFYAVSIYMAEVMCDDWTTSIEDIWSSYVVYPQTIEAKQWIGFNSVEGCDA